MYHKINSCFNYNGVQYFLFNYCKYFIFKYRSSTSIKQGKSPCNEKLSYILILVVWILPTLLLGLPKSFESGVEFRPGDGTESGYQCYSAERSTGANNEWTNVWFTKLQYTLNLINDASLLIIMLLSILLIWLSFERQANDQTTRQSTDLGKAVVLRVTQAKRKSLYKTAAFLCTPNILLRLPLYIYGRQAITNPPVGLGICTLLYNLQFCTHFIIYRFIHRDYDCAYTDMLRKLFPTCMKKEELDDEINVGPNKSKQEQV